MGGVLLYAELARECNRQDRQKSCPKAVWLHGSIHLFNKNKCNTRYYAPSSGNLESQWNTCQNYRENRKLFFEENSGLPLKFPLGHSKRRLNMQLSIKLFISSLHSNDLNSRRLWQHLPIWVLQSTVGGKGSNMFAKKAQTWIFAICFSIVKAKQHQHPMELLVSVGNADLNHISQIWLILTLIWDTFWHGALWSHTRAAESDSLKLKKSSRSFLIIWLEVWCGATDLRDMG